MFRIIGKYIPASQRPDGTWRKARRVKDGYVPQEEVPLYESKGKLFMKKPALPVGMCPIVAQQAKDKRERQQQQQKQLSPIPGLYIAPTTSNDSNQKKKPNAKLPNGLNNTESKSTKKSTPKSKSSATSAAPTSSSARDENVMSDAVSDMKICADEDPIKTIKKLRKKIREIEAIELKLSKNEKVDQDQMQKLKRKIEIVKQLSDLEADNK